MRIAGVLQAKAAQQTWCVSYPVGADMMLAKERGSKRLDGHGTAT
jgi:hypothetical protein